MDSTATDGIDSHLGEEELPPVPPSGVFDVRFIGHDIGINLGEGVLKDYRYGKSNFVGVKIHELKYQPGRGSNITFIWNFPPNVV